MKELLENESKYYKELSSNQEKQIEQLQSRINKAIEYISKLNSKGRDCEIYWDIKKEILNILKGEGK